MADDSMEISSDHGGPNATDDIDIDIDFTAGPTDEDYILEDPEPEEDTEFKEVDVEFKESFEPVPQTINDDVMVDDYTSSFKMEEIRDEDEQLQDIPDETSDVPDMEISNNTAPESDGTERKGASHGTEVFDFDDLRDLKDSAGENVSADVNESLSQTEPPHAEGASENLTSDVHPNSSLEFGVPDDANALPDSSDNPVNEAGIHSLSEKEVSAESTKEFSVIDDDNHDHLVEAVASSNASNEADVEATEELHNEKQSHWSDIDDTYGGIMVSYQDTQYALFSSSEDEDSDSFFLKDRSITKEPISSFLKALREILQEELDDEDELCIAIDVLRLEFGERSAEIDKVTFEELVNLHQQLLRNDGIDSPEPMHFTLGTRPEFAKRFVGLLAGASEGKGLSNLIPRDEESESYDDAETSIHVEEGYDPNQDQNLDGFEDDVQGDTKDGFEGDVQGDAKDGFEDDNKDAIDDGIQDDAKDDIQDAHALRDEHSLAQSDNTASALLEVSEDNVEDGSTYGISAVPEELERHVEIHSIGVTDEEHQDGLDSENLTNTISPARDAIVPGSENSEAAPREVAKQNDEEDLIDYSDEEFDDVKPKALPPSSRNASFEATNEELRRRSLLQKAKHASAVDAVNNETTKAANTDEQKPVDDTYDANEIDFDFDEDTGHSNNVPHESRKEDEEGDEAQVNQNESETFDDYYTAFDEQQGLEDDHNYDFGDEIGNENDIEGQDFNLKGLTSTEGEIASLKSNGTSPHEEISAESVTVSADTVDADEIDYDDNLPSTNVENSMSSDFLDQQQVPKSAKAEDIDEIDYDDDDDDNGNVTPKSQSGAILQTTSSSTPGKRQRSESMSEVAPGEGSQEAKRIRS